MVKAACANWLWWVASGASSAAFSSALKDPDAAQNQVLRSLLRKNASSAFGQEHGLANISTSLEFARRVPIRNYDEIRPWIDRIRRGEAHVLTGENVRRFVPTSGSSAAQKLIPYTTTLHRELNQAIGPWIFDLYRNYPRALLGVSYWAISPVAPEPFDSAEDSAVPIGFEDDAAYLGTFRNSLVNATLAVPSELKHIRSIEDWRYVTALLLLQRADLTLISVWHPSFLSLLLQTIRENWDQLLADMSSDSCPVLGRLPSSLASYIISRRDPRRSNELRNVSPSAIDNLWPNLEVVSCWADGHAAGAAAELASSLGSAVLQPKGLIATEGIISIPFKGRQPLAIRSHYLEFEDDSRHILLSSTLKEGHEYNVILTTGGGLYRYRLGDRIKVNGKLGRTPSISFLGKCEQVSDRMGEKLSDRFVASVFAELFQSGQSRPSFAMLAPDKDSDGICYTLFASTEMSNGLCAKLDLLLSANPHYAYCRRLAQLRPPRLFCVSGDAHRAYCERIQTLGKRMGDIKPVGLSALDDWPHHLNGHYVE